MRHAFAGQDWGKLFGCDAVACLSHHCCVPDLEWDPEASSWHDGCVRLICCKPYSQGRGAQYTGMQAGHRLVDKSKSGFLGLTDFQSCIRRQLKIPGARCRKTYRAIHGVVCRFGWRSLSVAVAWQLRNFRTRRSRRCSSCSIPRRKVRSI